MGFCVPVPDNVPFLRMPVINLFREDSVPLQLATIYEFLDEERVP